ncbi:hypothetical protein BZG01_14820 [Labilibaculum manganireducens]|uniref:Uncharacterized protein n=1 Tax=Labilibaculum manganireducens TaxID=1940525 RepID=A0A2N3I1G1_9BACT|nr:ACGX-repeat peptide [Labilibaculum manganireducens]PKQ64148.1 hypothetical protein BZG01_14820 [Labilibaculum manganireducens]
MNNLNSLNGWADNRAFVAPHSAQAYLNKGANLLASSCGSSEPKPQPSACGAGDPEPKPSACGAADENPPKPSACGSSCGSGEK